MMGSTDPPIEIQFAQHLRPGIYAPCQQEQFIDLQEDLIAIAECTKRLAEERRRIMVREGGHSESSTYRIID